MVDIPAAVPVESDPLQPWVGSRSTQFSEPWHFNNFRRVSYPGTNERSIGMVCRGGSLPRGRYRRRLRNPVSVYWISRPSSKRLSCRVIQHKLDRVRRPRVQITYDVETNGAMQKVELPFVVGVLADLSAQSTEPLKPLKDRPVVDIDRDNFNNVMAKAAPRVAMKVQNRLTGEDTKLAVELKFKHIDDFEPAAGRRAGARAQGAAGHANAADPVAQQDGGQRQARPVAGRHPEQHRQGQGPGQGTGHRNRRRRARRPSDEQRRTSTGRGSDGHPDDRSPQPAGPGDQGHPAPVGEGVGAGKDYFKQFLDQVVKPGQVVSKDVETNIKTWIGEIDKKLTAQLNEIMHDPAFQKLESTWRGLHYLVMQTETSTTLKIRVLNVKKQELFKDLEKAVEFDQSSLFKKIYEEEYGQLGGQPYGMLVGDLRIRPQRRGHQPPQDDLRRGRGGSCPVRRRPPSPKLFNFDSFTELANPRDLAKIFESVEYAAWKSFRESEDSRYVALTMPRVLGRLPYGENFKRVDEFNFEEQVDGKEHNNYLWMNAAWAYAARITDAFAKYGWLARTRGVEGGGKVEGLPVHTFPTDEGGRGHEVPDRDRHLRSPRI